MVNTLTPSRITFDVSRLTSDALICEIPESAESAVDVSRFTPHALFPGNTFDDTDLDTDLDTDPYLSAESASSAESAVDVSRLTPPHHKTRYYLRTYTPIAYPFPSAAGVKYTPTVSAHGQSCSTCPYLADCRRAVFHGDGLALCEDLLDSELYPPSVIPSEARNLSLICEIQKSAESVVLKEAIHA